MGSTVWCDKCKQPFATTDDRRIVILSVGREGSYASELTISQDYHAGECLNSLLEEFGYEEEQWSVDGEDETSS